MKEERKKRTWWASLKKIFSNSAMSLFYLAIKEGWLQGWILILGGTAIEKQRKEKLNHCQCCKMKTWHLTNEFLASFEKLQGLATPVLHSHVTSSQLDGTTDVPSPTEGTGVPSYHTLACTFFRAYLVFDLVPPVVDITWRHQDNFVIMTG